MDGATLATSPVPRQPLEASGSVAGRTCERMCKQGGGEKEPMSSLPRHQGTRARTLRPRLCSRVPVRAAAPQCQPGPVPSCPFRRIAAISQKQEQRGGSSGQAGVSCAAQGGSQPRCAQRRPGADCALGRFSASSRSPCTSWRRWCHG